MKVLLENFSISNNKIEVEKIYKLYYEYVNAERYILMVCVIILKIIAIASNLILHVKVINNLQHKNAARSIHLF